MEREHFFIKELTKSLCFCGENILNKNLHFKNLKKLQKLKVFAAIYCMSRMF